MLTKFLVLPEDINANIKWCSVHPTKKIISFIIYNEKTELIIFEYDNLFNGNPKLKQEDKENPFKLENIIIRKEFDNLNKIYWSRSGDILFCIKDNSIKLFNLNISKKKIIYIQDIQETTEIVSFCCSPVYDDYCIGTMAGKLIIYTDIKKKLKELTLNNKVVSLNYDAIGKYWAILTLANKCYLINLKTFEIEHEINISLNPNFDKLSVLKEDRKIDFSPDLNYLLIPSLDDKDIPFVCSWERNNNFQIGRIYYGYHSLISCIKFMPHIFEINKKLVTYFVICDIHMNITLWSTNKEQPLFLIKGEDKNSKVENIDFSDDCKYLFISCDNKYTFVIYLDNLESNFGKLINKKEYLQLNYPRLSSKKFEIKSFKDELNEKNFNKKINKINKLNIKKKETNTNKNEEKDNNQKTDREKTLEKNFKKSKKNNNENLIKFEKIPKEEAKISYIFNNKIIKIKKEVIQKLSNIESNNIYLNISIIILTDNYQVFWEILIEEKIEFLKYNEFYLIVYTENSNLYFYDMKNGKPIELPLAVDNLILITLNINNIFGMINNEGKLTIIDLKNFKNNYITNIQNIYKIYNKDWLNIINQKTKIIKINICFFINEEGVPILGFGNEKYYLYNNLLKNWFLIKQEFFDFNLIDTINHYIFNPNSEIFLDIKEAQIENLLENELEEFNYDINKKKGNEDFNENLNKYKDLMILNQLENSLIFSMKYQTLKEFSKNLKEYIIELISQKKINTLKKFIMDNLLGNQFSWESEYLMKNKIHPIKLIENIFIILKEYSQCINLCEELTECLKVMKKIN